MISIQQLVILLEFSWPHRYFNFNLSLNPERFFSAHYRHFETSLTKSIFANASQRGPLLFSSRKCITSQIRHFEKKPLGDCRFIHDSLFCEITVVRRSYACFADDYSYSFLENSLSLTLHPKPKNIFEWSMTNHFLLSQKILYYIFDDINYYILILFL